MCGHSFSLRQDSQGRPGAIGLVIPYLQYQVWARDYPDFLPLEDEAVKEAVLFLIGSTHPKCLRSIYLNDI